MFLKKRCQTPPPALSLHITEAVICRYLRAFQVSPYSPGYCDENSANKVLRQTPIVQTLHSESDKAQPPPQRNDGNLLGTIAQR